MKKSIYFSDKLQNQILPLYIDSFSSDKVKKNCLSFIKNICDYCQKDYLIIDTLHAQSYFNFLQLPKQPEKKQPAFSTIRLKHATFHAFSNYLIRNANLFNIEYTHNPFDLVNIAHINTQSNSFKIPTPAQMNAILHKCENEPILYAALSLIIRCGLKVGELTKLKPDCFILDDADQPAVVISYRKSQRYIKLPHDVLAILDFYWNNQTQNNTYLFENKSGNPMCVREFERLYKKCMGNDFQFTLSDLRNGCIALFCASGVSSKEIGQYIGVRQYNWLRRLDKIIPELALAPCDYSNLYIKPPPFSTNP